MIDPSIWANTPGMGRAPLLPAPQSPSGASVSPARDLAIRIMQASGNNRTFAGDRPVAFRPDPATLSNAQLAGFHEGYGGWNDPTAMGRAPGAVAGGLATLGAGVPAIGAALGAAGQKGASDYHGQLQAERTQRMAEAYETGQARESGAHQQNVAARANQATSIADAYEMGRQAASGNNRGQSRDQRDIERGGGGVSTSQGVML